MTNKECKERIGALEKVIADTFWMARRYAHGRSTYAPSMVRNAYNILKHRGITIKHDITIHPPKGDDVGGMRFREDFLDDINEK